MRRTQPWPEGTPCWLDVMTPDLAATQRFYGDLFGWAFETSPSGQYAKAQLRGVAVAGLMLDTDHQPVWNLYLATPDVDATVTKVVESGGSVAVAPFDAPGGRTAVCLEASGAAFLLWQAAGDLGCELVNEPGTYIWSELQSRDADAAQAFHATVFGAEIAPLGAAGTGYALVEVQGNVVAGIGPIPDGVPIDVPPHWRNYFASADVDATVAAARALGANVTTEPHDTPFGRWAGLADPLGARFCVITPPAA